jgi:hypothetical protein
MTRPAPPTIRGHASGFDATGADGDVTLTLTLHTERGPVTVIADVDALPDGTPAGRCGDAGRLAALLDDAAGDAAVVGKREAA